MQAFVTMRKGMTRLVTVLISFGDKRLSPIKYNKLVWKFLKIAKWIYIMQCWPIGTKVCTRIGKYCSNSKLLTKKWVVFSKFLEKQKQTHDIKNLHFLAIAYCMWYFKRIKHVNFKQSMQYLKFINFLNDSQKNDIFSCRLYAVKAKLRIAFHKKAGSPEQQN